MKGRPELYTRYEDDQAILNTPAKRVWLVALLVFAVLLSFNLSNNLHTVFAQAFAAGIGAIGLNLVSGYAGQVSLGHAFFIGLGAYTAAVVGDTGNASIHGFGIDNILVWLPLAGLVPAVVGYVIAPIATRLRGLYLAIVTLGLVFLGEHLFRTFTSITGGQGLGRKATGVALFGFRFDASGEVFGVFLARQHRFYLLALALLVLFGFLARNLARSRTGRAFAAVRDRDIAAEIMGVNLNHTKRVAFTVSSFYAGVTGALITAFVGFFEPTQFNLGLSIVYIAMILIGGVATISGSILGAMFIVLLPRLVQEVPHYIPFVSPRPVGGFLTVFQLEAIIYGGLLVAFILLEPRGLYGLWIRIRNYWKAFPFSY
jgi:branched-chain amino acid transport system permease protein